MGLTAVQGGQGPQGGQGLGVQVGGGRQGHQHLVAVEPGVVGAQIFHLDSLDGLDGRLLDQVDPVSPRAGQRLQGVEQGGGGAAISSEVLR